jgi:hypothetical protein
LAGTVLGLTTLLGQGGGLLLLLHWMSGEK